MDISVSVFSTMLVSLCYCYLISSRITKGFLRLISLLPIFIIFTVLPPFLPSVFFRAVLTLFITWLTNFKLLLFAFGQGPLSSYRSSESMKIFIVSSALPIRTKHGNDQKYFKLRKKLPFLNNLGTEILAFAVLTGFVIKYEDILHPKVSLVLYCFLVFLLVDCLGATSSFLVKAVAGMELEPPSDEPYLSTSLQDFWGRRWNLIVTNTLRQTVYSPVKSAAEAVVGKDLAPLPAVLVAFLVSGLMHELIFFYATGVEPSWEMTSFFFMHGICLVLEFAVKKGFEGRLKLPEYVSAALTVGFVIWSSFWLFFPPLLRSGAIDMVFEEFRWFGEICLQSNINFDNFFFIN